MSRARWWRWRWRRAVTACVCASALGSSLGCRSEPAEPAASASVSASASAPASASASLDPGALRASLVDGIEASLAEPGLADRVGVRAALATEASELALERLLARASADPELRRATDAFFTALQDGPAMRAALVEYAEQNPELDLSQISAGFVTHVDARLTRPELVEALEQRLRAELREHGEALTRAWFIDAGGGDALARLLVATILAPGYADALTELLGRESGALQDRLERRLGDPRRVALVLEGLAPQLELAATQVVVLTLDDERSAALLAAALVRLLETEELRAAAEELFGLALAPAFEVGAFDRSLAALARQPAVIAEARAWLGALARAPATREALATRTAKFSETPGLDALMSRALQ